MTLPEYGLLIPLRLGLPTPDTRGGDRDFISLWEKLQSRTAEAHAWEGGWVGGKNLWPFV